MSENIQTINYTSGAPPGEVLPEIGDASLIVENRRLVGNVAVALVYEHELGNTFLQYYDDTSGESYDRMYIPYGEKPGEVYEHAGVYMGPIATEVVSGPNDTDEATSENHQEDLGHDIETVPAEGFEGISIFDAEQGKLFDIACMLRDRLANVTEQQRAYVQDLNDDQWQLAANQHFKGARYETEEAFMVVLNQIFEEMINMSRDLNKLPTAQVNEQA